MKNRRILLCTILALTAVTTSCKEENPAPGFSAAPGADQSLNTELAEPDAPFDNRQRDSGIEFQLEQNEERLKTLEAQVAELLQFKKETNEFLKEATLSFEANDRRMEEVERKNRSLETRLGASNRGGFQR